MTRKWRKMTTQELAALFSGPNQVTHDDSIPKLAPNQWPFKAKQVIQHPHDGTPYKARSAAVLPEMDFAPHDKKPL